MFGEKHDFDCLTRVCSWIYLFIYLLTCELMSSGLRMAKKTPIYRIKLYNE